MYIVRQDIAGPEAQYRHGESNHGARTLSPQNGDTKQTKRQPATIKWEQKQKYITPEPPPHGGNDAKNRIQIAALTDVRKVAHCLIKTHAIGTSHERLSHMWEPNYNRKTDAGNLAAAEGRSRALVGWAGRNN